jgi:hypothetical protein
MTNPAVGMGESIRAAFAAYAADSSGNLYPTEEDIHDYTTLRTLVNANGGMLPETEDLAGVSFGDYTTFDTDGDHIHDAYSMRLRVTEVSTKQMGWWCVVITPKGIDKCAPLTSSSS